MVTSLLKLLKWHAELNSDLTLLKVHLLLKNGGKLSNCFVLVIDKYFICS